MSDQRPTTCPNCKSENIYQDVSLWICTECFNEWVPSLSNGAMEESAQSANNIIKDANGNVLTDGDSVVVIKDLKVKGSSSVVKVGTKVKNIRLIDGDDGHDIACKIDGFGSMNLKSEFVKKA